MSDNIGGEERREKGAAINPKKNRSGTGRSRTVSESVVDEVKKDEKKKADNTEGHLRRFLSESALEAAKEDNEMKKKLLDTDIEDKKVEKDEHEKREKERALNEAAVAKLLEEDEKRKKEDEKHQKWKDSWNQYIDVLGLQVAYDYHNREYAYKYGATDSEHWPSFEKDVSKLMFDSIEELNLTKEWFRSVCGSDESPERLKDMAQRVVDKNNKIEEEYYRRIRLSLLDKEQKHGEGLPLRDPLPDSDESDNDVWATAESDLESIEGAEDALAALTKENKTIFQEIVLNVEKAKNTVEAAHKKLTKDAFNAQKRGAALEKQMTKSQSEASLKLDEAIAQLDALEEATASKGLLGKMKESYDNIRDTVGKWKMSGIVPYLPQSTVYVNVATVVTRDDNGDSPEDQAPPAAHPHGSNGTGSPAVVMPDVVGDAPAEEAPPAVPAHQVQLRLPTAPPVEILPNFPPFWAAAAAQTGPSSTSATTTTLPTRPLSSVPEEIALESAPDGFIAPSSKIVNGMIEMPSRKGRRAHSRSGSLVTASSDTISPSRPPIPNGDVPHEQPPPRQSRPGIVRRAMAWVRRRFSRGGRQTSETSGVSENDYEVIPEEEKKEAEEEKKDGIDAEKKEENEKKE